MHFSPPPALADYFGLEVVDRTDLTICKDASEPEIPFKLDVCEIHVVFDDPADRLISVAFSNVSTTDPAGFFQHSMNPTNTAPSCPFIALFPTLVCDSFVTLGVECVDFVDNTTIDPDFDAAGFNFTGEVSGGWYNSAPANGQGDPDANGRVMIARFSYKQNKNTSGEVCVFTQLAGSRDIIAFLLQPFDCSVPGGGLPASGGGGGTSGTICYVDDDEESPNDCLGNWANACPDLQTALSAASAGACNEIWVAEGTYLPSDCNTNNPPCVLADRSDSFQLLDGVSIYGGFPNGGGNPTFGDRDPETFISVLSGDINQNDTPLPPNVPDFPGCDFEEGIPTCGTLVGANSYHVVDGSDTDATALLDGFYITAGLADVDPPQAPNDRGAGIYVLNGSPTIRDCTVAVNLSVTIGGGVYLENSNAVIEQDSCIAHNVADFGGGGGIRITFGAPTIQDSTILGNKALVGGGIRSRLASPTIRFNLIRINQVRGNLQFGPRGAGISLSGEGSGTTLVEGNIIEENTGSTGDCASACDQQCTALAQINGAGMYVKDTTVDGTEIRDNTMRSNDAGGGDGGGMYCKDASPRVEGNLFVDNKASRGAGMFNYTSNPLVVDCEFRHNGFDEFNQPFTDAGGGMYNDQSDPGIYNSRFIDNGAKAGSGGGVYNLPSLPSVGPTFVNCLFADNQTFAGGSGAGMFNAGGSPSLVNCTFSGNTTDDRGGAMFNRFGAEVTLDNCILWGDSAPTPEDGDEIYIEKSATVTVNWTDVRGGEADVAVEVGGTLNWGDGNIGEDLEDDDPKFANPGGGNLRITPGSACIDAASNLEVPPDVADLDDDGDEGERTPFDLDLKPRFIQDPDTEDTGQDDPGPPPIPEMVDMGCYEFQLCPGGSGPCPWDLSGDGDVGPFDLALLLGDWGLNPGSPADFDCDGFVGSFDLALLLGNWGSCPPP